MIENEAIVNLQLDSLIPNRYQPRKIFNDDTINELSISIKQYGVINPILVRQNADKYEIIAGERRVRAAKQAGLTTIPAIIKKVEDKEMAELALIENIQRENITPIEEAKTYEQIMTNNNLTEDKISEMIGKSQPHILNKLRLLTLPSEVQYAIMNKKISEKHARTLLKEQNTEKQIELLKRIINEKISVRELENIIKKETKKELEKESDTMNNGNFFPNFNTNPTPAPIDTNISAMNMQPTSPVPTTPGTPPAVEITPMTYTPQMEVSEGPQVMPTQVETSTVPEQSIMPTQELSVNNMQPIMPEQNIQPVTDNISAESIQPEPIPVTMPPVQSVPEVAPPPMDSISDIPLFASQNNNISEAVSQVSESMEENKIIPEPIITEPEPLPEEPPLFPENNQEPVSIPLENSNSGVEEKVNIGSMELDKYFQVKKFLEDNNIPYKAYTNEASNCIIIEF